MDIDKHDEGEEIRITLAGELTTGMARRLRQELLEALARERAVVLDMGRVTEIEPACLQVLVAARRSFSAADRKLSLQESPQVRQVWNDGGYPRDEVSSAEDNHDGG